MVDLVSNCRPVELLAGCVGVQAVRVVDVDHRGRVPVVTRRSPAADVAYVKPSKHDDLLALPEKQTNTNQKVRGACCCNGAARPRLHVRNRKDHSDFPAMSLAVAAHTTLARQQREVTGRIRRVTYPSAKVVAIPPHEAASTHRPSMRAPPRRESPAIKGPSAVNRHSHRFAR